MYYALVRSILCNNLAGVLTSEKNAPQLRGILETILAPIIESKDLRVRLVPRSMRAYLLHELKPFFALLSLYRWCSCA